MNFGTVLLLLAAASAQYHDSSFNYHAYSSYTIPRSDVDSFNVNTATKYTGIQGKSIYVRNTGKNALIYSTDSFNNTNVVKFSIRSTPRFAIETKAPNANAQKTPNILLSAKLVGLFEDNIFQPQAVPFKTHGTSYKFKDFDWSDITLSTRIDTTSATLIFNSYGTFKGKDHIVVNLTAYISPDSYMMGNTPVGPSSLKYDFDVLGSPSYTLKPSQSSSWNLVKAVFSSQPNANVLPNAIQYENESSEVGWAEEITVDGNPSTVTFRGIASVPNDLKTQDDVDKVCAKSMVTFNIPHFKKSVSWDPSLIRKTLSGASQLIL
ncbi:hypothetical protein HDV01_007725 [Terramyces sp. JEL0728]|nr:hypothetical protein HDV01_007725 [Terramyces sp. JEL0728]